jgi:Pvc16 N-terminal domain
MSSYQAIAAVSRTLRSLLRDRMQESVTVTLAPPDVTLPDVTTHRLNLYLYLVAENGSLKNLDLPSSPLCLNLHYLMTAYASDEATQDADLTAQQILGDAMRVLHDFAIIHPTLHEDDDPLKPRILDPVLVGETERVKLTLQPTNLDELSKIWTSLPQSHLRRSVAYEVSVIKIDGGRPRGPALPVKTRRLHVTLAERPEITAVYRTPVPPEPKGDPRVRLLQELTLEGSGFSGNRTWVRFGGLQRFLVTPESDSRLRIDVPDDRFPLANPTPNIAEEHRLQPGPQILEVIVERPTETVSGGLGPGVTGTGQQLLTSNQAVFLLVPRVATVNPTSGSATDPNALLTVTGKRLFREGLKSYVLLGDAAVEIRRPVGTDPWAVPTETSVQVPLAPLAAALPKPPPAAPYRVRVLVNGAQSLEEGVIFTLTP